MLIVKENGVKSKRPYYRVMHLSEFVLSGDLAEIYGYMASRNGNGDNLCFQGFTDQERIRFLEEYEFIRNREPPNHANDVGHEMIDLCHEFGRYRGS